MNNLKQNEIDKIKEWLMLECELDDEIFNNYFVNLGMMRYADLVCPIIKKASGF